MIDWSISVYSLPPHCGNNNSIQYERSETATVVKVAGIGAIMWHMKLHWKADSNFQVG